MMSRRGPQRIFQQLFPGRQPRWHTGHGRGFTLLEVVLSMTIFFTSIAMLAQINWNATRAAVQSRLRGQALLRCEAKLQEVVAGAIGLTSQMNVPFEDDETWQWSLTSTATIFPGLLLVEVTVSRQTDSALGATTQTLRRWLRDPAEMQNAASSANTAAGTSSGGGL